MVSEWAEAQLPICNIIRDSNPVNQKKGDFRSGIAAPSSAKGALSL